MISPKLRRKLDSYKPPKQYRVEKFDNTCGLWGHVETVYPNWPTTNKTHAFLWWSFVTTTQRVGDINSIERARRRAFGLIDNREGCRIIEVKVNGTEFVIYGNGEWLSYQ